jgi:hypothetical protein
MLLKVEKSSSGTPHRTTLVNCVGGSYRKRPKVPLKSPFNLQYLDEMDKKDCGSLS